MNASTKRLVTSGMLVALAVVLSFVKISPQFLYGGAVTAFSMVPVAIIAYMYGTRWGLCCGAVYGVLQGVFGAVGSQAFAGLDPLSTVLMALLDYLVALAVLGLAGIFRGRIGKHGAAVAVGAAFAALLRFVCHFASGVILWSGYAEWFFTDVMNNSFGASILQSFSGTGLAVIYSAVYNGLYMVPEIILTAIGAAVVMGIAPLRNQILAKN
ncbi:MAG: energy-coupled thiamine transporter ThiT [Clostridia bacterium]|nr:energy-coupled thiamine transporter ThiT [Clostridia bacterium]